MIVDTAIQKDVVLKFPKYVGLAGMPGAGKGYVSQVLREEWEYVPIDLSSMIDLEAEQKGIEQKRENLLSLGRQMRRDYGEAVLAKRIVEDHIPNCIERAVIMANYDTEEQIAQNGPLPKVNYALVGIRHPGELAYLKRLGDNFRLIAVQASQPTRFERVKVRGRQVDAVNFEQFQELDQREIGNGVLEVMEDADFVIPNEDGYTREAVIADLAEFFSFHT